MATTPKVLTYEEWLKLPEAEGIEEVVMARSEKCLLIKYCMPIRWKI